MWKASIFTEKGSRGETMQEISSKIFKDKSTHQNMPFMDSCFFLSHNKGHLILRQILLNPFMLIFRFLELLISSDTISLFWEVDLKIYVVPVHKNSLIKENVSMLVQHLIVIWHHIKMEVSIVEYALLI